VEEPNDKLIEGKQQRGMKGGRLEGGIKA